MAYFDRFDICEAYAVLEWDWNMGGWLQERPTAGEWKRRPYSLHGSDSNHARIYPLKPAIRAAEKVRNTTRFFILRQSRR
jgi:hypothetical protein